jgi:phosphatidylethanolamine-binding protein (PEBP) family uncharacterized protein
MQSNHGMALVDPTVVSLDRGALDAQKTATGVRVLRMGRGRGYLGSAPPKEHGPHRYVLLFALAKRRTAGSKGPALDAAKPSDVIAVAGEVLARRRLDGFYKRT